MIRYIRKDYDCWVGTRYDKVFWILFPSSIFKSILKKDTNQHCHTLYYDYSAGWGWGDASSVRRRPTI